MSTVNRPKQSKRSVEKVPNQGKAISFDPNSAEGKALQRAEAIKTGGEVEWVTTIREGDPIDEEALDRWLTERSYSV